MRMRRQFYMCVQAGAPLDITEHVRMRRRSLLTYFTRVQSDAPFEITEHVRMRRRSS